MFTVCPVEFVADKPYPFLGKPRLPGEIEQPGNVQARLVAMVVRALKTGKCVCDFSTSENRLARLCKDSVQTLIEFVRPDFLYQAVRIMGYKECVLHGIALLKASPGLVRVKIVYEPAVRSTRTDKAFGFVKEL